MTAAIEVLARAMSEAELLSSVTAGTRKRPGLCKLLGLRWYHVLRAEGSSCGFPDLVITGGTRTIFRELKTMRGRLSKAQQAWLADLQAAGDDAGVWRPVDFLNGRIERELKAIARPKTRARAA